MLFYLTHLISSIFLILARDLLLVKARAARAVARMMTSAPTITLEPALTTELREAAAACFSRSLEAEEIRQLDFKRDSGGVQTYTHRSRQDL